jgi:sugar O-acyltransferase (sialic acid O-acetyltransferase NeuD family)
MQNLIIYGAGKIASIVYHYLKSTFKVRAFTVDHQFILANTLFDLPVIPFDSINKSHPPHTYKMIIAVGYHDMNNLKAKKYLEAKEKGYDFVSYVDNDVKKFDDVTIGENCIILDNTTIQPFVEIGNNSVIWSNVTIAHGVKIGDNCWIASGAVVAGDTVIKSNCFIGINATIGHNVTIGEANYIGANSTVCKNTSTGDVYIAEQATKFRLNSDQFMQFTRQ